MDIHDYSRIPDHMMKSLIRYIDHGVPPGHFLTALICNDLKNTCGRADATNIQLIPVYVSYLYNIAPANCWGSAENFSEWINAHRSQQGQA